MLDIFNLNVVQYDEGIEEQGNREGQGGTLQQGKVFRAGWTWLNV